MIDPARPDYASTPIAPSRGQFSYAPAKAASEPLVSIVTPFFNTKELLHQTAQCVLNQSLQRFEWLIVNDCSTDPDALRILDQYRRQDARIRVIDHAQNKGPGAARNTGYAQARAPFVFQMDDDDLLELTAIEKMRWYLESFPEVALVNGWSVAFGAKEYLWPTGFERGDELLEENLATGRALVRAEAHRRAGGFDESIRGGMEDWDFWLRCAAAGLWGATIPEYLDWYRRRDTHSDRWQDWDGGDRTEQFKTRLRQTYPRLFAEGVPRLQRRQPTPLEPMRREMPFTNALRKDRPRLLMIAPWMEMGGLDKFNLDVFEQLTRRGWEVTLAATDDSRHPWQHEFARFTPDIFVLSRFLSLPDYPLFLRYLIDSRQPDAVLLTHSELGYWLLPYLRTHCPRPAYVDYNHTCPPHWKHGGFARYGAASSGQLDLNIASSQTLKDWMIAHGADAGRVEVVYTNIDPQRWRPDAVLRGAVRAELALPDDLPVILYAVRLVYEKQPQVFAETMAALAERGLRFGALVAGDGPDGPWLREFVRRHHLADRVRLLGPQPLERMRGLLAASDILFLPSRWEGVSLTLFEAMACGLVAVSTDVGGQRELLTPDVGFLLPLAEPAEQVQRFADVLAGLIADPAGRMRRGGAARRRIEERFSIDQMAEGLLACLARAGELSRQRPHVPATTVEADEAAARAVEFVRVNAVADKLWSQLNGRAAEASSGAALASAKAFFQQHSGRLEDAVQELREELATVRTWNRELETARDWLADQLQRHQRSVDDLRTWATELEQAKAWHIGERDRFERELSALRGACERWQRQGLVRLLTRARLVRRLAAEEKNTTEAQRHREEER